MPEHQPVAGNVHFTVPGRIGGKQRAGRLIEFRHDGKPVVRSFNPTKSKKWEKTIADCASTQAMRQRSLLSGPLGLEVRMFLRHPQSWSKKKKRETLFVTGKPDCDNILKTIADALNKVAWHDDSQLCHLIFSRGYTNDAERTEITIFRMEPTA